MKHLSFLRSLRRHLGRSLLTALVCALTVDEVNAQTIRYVKPDGSGDGNSWATASANLQAIINASSVGDQVWVAAGTYKPGGSTNTDRTISFSMKDGVAIYGGFTGTERAISERPTSITASPSGSILSGDLGTPGEITDNSEHIIVNTNLTSTAILDGFVVTAATLPKLATGGGMRNVNSSPTIRNCYFTNHTETPGFDGGYAGGGGIYNDAGSNALVVNCTFDNNKLWYGTGVMSESVSLTLVNCTFTNNTGGTSGAVIGKAVTMTNCVFSNNYSSSGSGGGGSSGGGARVGDGSYVANCLFSSNTALGYGGGLSVGDNATVVNCVFRGNKATGFGGAGNSAGYGGAVSAGSSLFVNCSFSNNEAGGRNNSGGGAIVAGPTTNFVNCSFAGNKCDRAGGAIAGSGMLINCIIWGNTPNGVNGGVSSAVKYTITQDNTPGTGNFMLDPLFVDVAGDNLRLLPCSPAIDRGSNTYDANTKYNNTTTDPDNKPRLVRQIDIGAYEFQGTPQALATITQQPPSSREIPLGGTLTAIVSASGTVSSYQWYKDNVAIAGATSATLTITGLTTADAGRYKVVASGICNSVTSNELVLVVNIGMYTVKAGQWDDASIWSMNRVPISSDDVRINHPVTVSNNSIVRAHRISYAPGQTLQVGTGSRVSLAQ
jgi:predicted outer membrane repeat protein